MKGAFFEVTCGVCGKATKLYFSSNTVAWFRAFSSEHWHCKKYPHAFPVPSTAELTSGPVKTEP